MLTPAVLDTCVLVPSILRNLLLEIASRGVYEVRWSAETERELDRVLRKWRASKMIPDSDTDAYIKRLISQMHQAFPYAKVDWGDRRDEKLDGDDLASSLPDPNDLHILEAAFVAEAKTIVTFNVRVFPAAITRQVVKHCRVVTPDKFLLTCLNANKVEVTNALATIAARTGMRGQKLEVKEILAYLQTDVPRFVSEVYALL